MASIRFIIVALLLWLGYPGAAVGAPTVLVLGDSLSAAFGIAAEEDWVELLRRRLDEAGYPHRVVNASASGETTAGGLRRLPDLIRRHDPSVVVIELGGNDGLRGQRLDSVNDNLAAMIETAQLSGARVLLVGMRLPPNYGTAYTRRFHRMYVDLAERHRIPLVPFLLEGVAGESTLMQPDGIHANAEAQPKLLENVWPHLEPLLSGTVHLTPQTSRSSDARPESS